MAGRKPASVKGPAAVRNQQGQRQIGTESRNNPPKRVERTSTAGGGTPPLVKTTLRENRIRVTKAT